ncbi:TAD3 [Hepatospora eriocheir]|uniref:TAD3 n=1 Tax=Hepatospora eriocheir TaxID=1081669 RepID=A0A1X0QG84_9MICR|nr:TAD3 [Hepatospora eriocheir]
MIIIIYKNFVNDFIMIYKVCYSYEQEKKMYFIEMNAVIIESKSVNWFIKTNPLKLPNYIKRVAKYDDNHVICLTKDFGDIKIKVPAFKPLTNEHLLKIRTENLKYNLLRNIPTYFEDTIIIDKVFEDIKNNNFLCCGYCIITDTSYNIIYTEYDDDDFLFGHSILKCVSYVSSKKLNYEKNYLCTGLYCFLYNEPCTSCAMALVHGRIKKVFIVNQSGVYKTFSKFKFNFNKNLNHRFKVYFNKQIDC